MSMKTYVEEAMQPTVYADPYCSTELVMISNNDSNDAIF